MVDDTGETGGPSDRRTPEAVLTREDLAERAAAKRERHQVRQDAAAARRLERAEAKDRRADSPTRGLRAGFFDQDPDHFLGVQGRRDAERQNRQLLLTKQLLDEQRETNRLLEELLKRLS